VSDFQRKVEEKYAVRPETPAAPPTEAAASARAAMPDPTAPPATAAEALQAPPPELSLAAQQQGIRSDPEERQRVYAEAEREGVIPFARQAERLFAELVGQPMPTGEETEDRLYRLRGAARVEAGNRRVTDSWEWLTATVPATAAWLKRTGLLYHERTWDLLLELYNARYDASTPGGERRRKAKYAARMGG
jgi:hypothetical protein